MSLLLLAALAANPAPSPLSAADSADGRCIVLLGFIGSHGTPEQARAAAVMIPYYLGRLSARNPDSAIPVIVTRAGDEAKAGGISAREEGARCQAAYSASSAAFTGGLRSAVGQPDPAAPR